MKQFASNAAAWLSGALFGAGLLVSGMTKPSNIQAFLDVTGEWDPGLALVMVGAIAVYATLRRIVLGRKAPLFDGLFHTPKTHGIDARLVGGAALFGIGWGLGGFCPGPAFVALAAGGRATATFVIGMAIGTCVVVCRARRANAVDSTFESKSAPGATST